MTRGIYERTVRIQSFSNWVFVDALYQAFAADQEPADLTIAQVLDDFVPLSKLMSEQINGLRQWAKGRL